MSDFLVVEENLRAAMRFFGEASGSGEVRALDGTVAVFSGLDYGVFNIGLLTRGVRGNTSELETRLADLGHFFGERTLRWSFWLCEDLLDTPARRRERQTFTSFGMRAISHPPGMLAPALLAPVRELPAIEMLRVADAPTRAAFAEITSVAFEIPHMVARAVYSRAEAWKGSYEGFVGMVNGRAVAIIAIVVEAGAMGVYSLATMPEFRRMGYGEALLRCATAEIRARTGLTRLVLQSTEAGYKLYRRMGFHDVTKFSVYLTK